MSRSPKYSFAQMSRQIRDALRREQEARRRRRQEAAEREQHRAVAGAAARHRAAAAALNGDAAAAGLDGRLAGVLDRLGAATTAEHLAEAVAELDQVRRAVHRHRVEVAVRDLESTLDQLRELAGEISGTADRARFDPGAYEIDAGLARLRNQVAPSAADVAAFAREVTAHLDRVRAGRAQADRDRDAADDLVGRLSARLESLRADAAAARVPLTDGDRAGDAIAMLRERITAQDLAEVPDLGVALGRKLDGIEEGLDAVIDQIAERRAILGSLVKALPEVGFAVDAGSLVESPDGAIGVRAVRSTGEAVALTVTAEDEGNHRVRYASETVRREASACGNLLDVINVLHLSAERDGVVLSAVTWEGRDEDPPPGTGRRALGQSTETVRQEAFRWQP